MHIKFLAHGTGSAARAVAYLTGRLDHQGREREQVEVLVGDPQQVAAVADSLGTVHRYSSAVIAFHPEDRPTKVQIAVCWLTSSTSRSPGSPTTGTPGPLFSTATLTALMVFMCTC